MAATRQLWLQEEPRRRGLHFFVRSTELKHAELFLAKEEEAAEQTLHNFLQEEEEKAKEPPFVRPGKHQQFHDDIALVALLKACTQQKDLSKGIQIHADVFNRGLLKTNSFIANTLVNMYAKCGALARAQQVFDEIPFPNVVSWNALVAGYVQHGNSEKAVNCFCRMRHQGLSPDAVTSACILKACGSIGAVKKGKEVHAEIVTTGLLTNDIVLGTALVDMYAKCGALAKAQQILDELPLRNVASWNALITGYGQHGHHEKALTCFEWMKCEGISPNAVTYACISKACGSIGPPEKSQAIHAEIIREGLFENNIVLGSALVDMYVKCGVLSKAQQVFDELGVRDVVSWTGLIAGYCQHEHCEEALKCFEQLKCEGLSPNAITFSCILKACGRIGAADKGREIHAEILRKGLMLNDTVLGSALADMYAKCGVLARAREVFDELSVRDVITWNALIAGYCECRNGNEALKCFEWMKCEDFSPDAATFSCILKACGSIGAAEKGIDIHAEIDRKGLLRNSMVLGNALVNMYAKCGVLTNAQQVFEELPARDVVSWNALIAGYCEQGHGEEALGCFEQMLHEGLFPDGVTFSFILKACNSIGAAKKGQLYFETMNTPCGIVPSLEHHTCMVDLFGNAGQFDKAISIIEKVPPSDDYSAWFALLGSCKKWGNVKLGRSAFKHAVKI